MAPGLIDRRSFLGGAAASAAAIAASTIGPSTARAIEPIGRANGPKFKFSLAAYSYRELFSAKKFVDKPFTIEEFVGDCAKMQLEGTELTSYYFPENVTPDYLRNIKRLAFLQGLDVSGTAVGNDFCHPPGKELDKEIALVKTWVDNAAILGAPVIRIFSGKQKRGQDVADARKQVIAAIEQCCDYSGQHGVTLALENHGGLTDTADHLLELVHGVKSPWFGVNFDSGNFHSADPYAELEQIAPYAVNVQIKVLVAAKGKSSVRSDFARLAKILRAANYRGYVALEYEEGKEPRQACPEFIKSIREAFA